MTQVYRNAAYNAEIRYMDGHLGHGRNLYEEEVRVPLIAKRPGYLE